MESSPIEGSGCSSPQHAVAGSMGSPHVRALALKNFGQLRRRAPIFLTLRLRRWTRSAA